MELQLPICTIAMHSRAWYGLLRHVCYETMSFILQEAGSLRERLQAAQRDVEQAQQQLGSIQDSYLATQRQR